MGQRRQDGWARRAQQEHYPARSVYKLAEIDRRYRVLAPGARVLDLGCAPGSWLKYAAEKVGGNGRAMGRVVGVDLTPVQNVPANARVVVADVFALDPAALDETEFDCVLSDLAPSTTGARDVDHLRSVALARQALAMALRLLVPGGNLVVKVFDGPEGPTFLKEVRAVFGFSKAQRPAAVRKESREFFAVGMGFRR